MSTPVTPNLSPEAHSGDTIDRLSQAVEGVIGSHWERERHRCARIVVEECVNASRGYGRLSEAGLAILILGQKIHERIVRTTDGPTT